MPRPITGRPVGRPPKVNPRESAPADNDDFEIPEIPDGLGPYGSVLWFKIWSTSSDILTPADEFAVDELCQIFEEKQFVRDALETGAVPRAYKSANGQINNHPFVKQLSDLRVQMNSRMSDLGLNPVARARLGVDKAMAEDPQLAELLRRRTTRDQENQEKREENK